MKNTILKSLLVFLMLTAVSAQAYDFRAEDDIYLTGNFDEDLLLFGTSVSFDGFVRGDILTATRTLTFDGEIDGNLCAAGERLTVNGDVRRSIRCAGQYVTINSVVEGDVIVFGQQILLSNQATVMRDCALFGADLTIDGTIESDCDLHGGVVTISGRIMGDVDISGGQIILTPQAVIEGDLNYESHEKARISPEAQILGDTKWKRTRDKSGTEVSFPATPPPQSWLWGFLFLCGSLLIGVLIIVFKHDMVERITSDMKKNGLLHFLMGLLVVLLMPVLILLIAITVIGLPVAAAGMTVYFLLFILAKIVVGIWLGRLLLEAMSHGKKVSLGWSLVLGMLLLFLLFKIPVLGWVIYLLAWVMGAGALTMCFFRRKRVVVETEQPATPA
ncbi:MAG: polymer-forming cytoskeletal protein [bacterium]